MPEGPKAVVYSNAPRMHEQVVIQAHLHGQWMMNHHERKKRKFCEGWGIQSAVPLGPRSRGGSLRHLAHGHGGGGNGFTQAKARGCFA